MRTFSKQKNPFQNNKLLQNQRNLTTHKYDDQESDGTEAQKILKIGKYKIYIDELLGKGYSSKVYKGTQEGKHLKKYAIKVIQLRNFSFSCLKLFQREIEIHRNLNHDHIVKCFDIIKTESHIYMVLEYCPHGDLSSYIKQKKKISENSLIDIMSQIVDGYKYLANQGILHRDLKPANILRSGKIWKISDFGFSIKSKCLVDQVNVGTPLYMPLQSLSRSYYSVKTDIFALGIILFQMLHGKTPWQCKSEKQLIKKLNFQKLTIERQIQNLKLKQFIVRSCDLKEQNRLSKQELQNFEFLPANSQDNGRKSLSASVSSKNIFFHHSLYKTEDKENYIDMKGYIKENNQILFQDLQYCRFIFYMAQNIDSFLIQQVEKESFLMTLLKYLIRIMKNVSNSKLNCLRLKHFDQYKTTKDYISIQSQFDDYSVRYERVYLDFIKTADIKTIRIVNSKFPEFSQSGDILNSNFYSKLKYYLVFLLRENNHLLSQIMNDQNEQNNLPERIEAFKNLFLYYKIADVRSKGENLKQKLRFISNYKESKLQKIDYLNIRKQIKHI